MIKHILMQSIAVKQALLLNDQIINTIEQVINLLETCFTTQNKVWFCGNGGSAADAQHLAAELSGRFYLNRKGLPAEVLHGNSSYITAVANDYGFEEVYARMVEAQGQKNDVLILISTSGNSENIIRAAKKAIEKELIIVGFTGELGGKLAELCHYCIKVPSQVTPRIQECHITIGHIICEAVEKRLFGK